MEKNSNTTGASHKTYLLSNDFHSAIIGFCVCLLMIVIYLWMASGLMHLVMGLYHAFPNDWTHSAENMIKDVVVILASFELIRVLQSYLVIGRVKVTFILDVALVVLIGELIGLWYAQYEVREVLLSILVIAALIALRIITTRYSPNNSGDWN